MLDSFGVPGAQFLWGNYFWLGSIELCDDLNAPYSISLGGPQLPNALQLLNVTSPFPVHYMVVYYNFTTPYYIDLHLPFDVSPTKTDHINVVLFFASLFFFIYLYERRFFVKILFLHKAFFIVVFVVADVFLYNFRCSFSICRHYNFWWSFSHFIPLRLRHS